MADPTLVVRVAANLSEFKSNLAEGVDQIETYKSALSRAASAFDGSRIVQQASAAAAAIQSAGGVSSLTASEMAKANTMFTEAAAKLELMGKGGTYASQQFQALADATKQVQHPTEELGQSWVARIAEGLLLRDAINEVLGKVKELAIGVPEEAHALNLLSLQTQVNVEDLQVLAGATREYGVDGEQLGKALYQLGRRIAGNDDSVATAYHLMGMSLDEVRGMNAMDLFLTTERGLGKLQGTIRDTAAADLYGGRLGVSMGAFATGADEAIEKARALNVVASKDSVKALADYQDAVDRATHSVHAWVMELEGGAAQGFNTLTGAADKGASKWAIFMAVLKDFAASNIETGASTSNLATLIDRLNQQTEKNTVSTKTNAEGHREAAVALDAHGQAARFMAALELDAGKPVLEWQSQYLQHLKDIGELTAKNAAGIGVSGGQLKEWTRATEAASAATEAAYAATLKWDEELAHMDKETFTLAMEHQKVWREEQAKQTARSNAAILLEFEAQTKLNAEWGLNAAGAIKVQSSALDSLNLKLAELHANRVEGISQEKQEQVLLDEYTKQLHDEAVAQNQVAVSTTRAAEATVSATDKFNAFKNTLVLGLSNIDDMNSALSKFYDALAAVGNLGSMAGPSGLGVPVGNSAGLPRVPGMAGHADGILNNPQGHWAMVGERGPEPMYVPTGASILPSGSSPSSGGGTQVIQLVVDGRVLASIVTDHQTRSMKQVRQYPAA